MKYSSVLRSSWVRSSLVLATMASSVAGCSSADATHDNTLSQSEEIRDLSVNEALDDFDQIASSFRGLYGALERKQARYHFNFEDLVTSYRDRVAAAHSDVEFQGIFKEFVSRFNDPHVSLGSSLYADSTRIVWLPFDVIPVGDTYVVSKIYNNIKSIKVGDEVLSFNGTPIEAILEQLSKYAGVANPLTVKHENADKLTLRGVYLSKGIKGGDAVTVHVRGASGDERDASVAWNESPRPLPAKPKPIINIPAAGETNATNAVAYSSRIADLLSESATPDRNKPFFFTPQVQALLNFKEVKPSAAALEKYDVSPDLADQINYFAATYVLKNKANEEKKILFLRIPDYVPGSNLLSINGAVSYIRALFDEQKNNVDALVLDETHNPGGYVYFAEKVLSLVAKGHINGYVQRINADRKWITSFKTDAAQTRITEGLDSPLAADYDRRASLIDDAYSQGRRLSEPLAIEDSPTIEADPGHWTKPLLVLTDELSVSCADFVPAVIKANHLGRLFGQTTMGGGGNVELVATLANSGSKLNISRGLGLPYDPTGKYENEEEITIEDNGVTPDTIYNSSLKDYRAGYVGYVSAFNNDLLENVLK